MFLELRRAIKLKLPIMTEMNLRSGMTVLCKRRLPFQGLYNVDCLVVRSHRLFESVRRICTKDFHSHLFQFQIRGSYSSLISISLTFDHEFDLFHILCTHYPHVFY